MKILLVNTYSKGGAAKACIRLHLSLLEHGLASKLLLKVKKNHNTPESYLFESSSQLEYSLSFRQKLKNKFIRIARELKLLKEPKQEFKKSPEDLFLSQRRGLETFSFPNTQFDITESPLYAEADIIHLHWVADLLDYPSFFAKNTKPVVWTLHDESPFEGGEHYTQEFLGIDEQGKPIKRIYTEIELYWQQKILAEKKIIFQPNKNINIISPSSWLANLSINSEVFRHYPHKVISNGVDTNIFKLLNQCFCREVFNLPTNKKIILFVADSIENERKGYVYLQKALENLKSEDVVLCAIGDKNNSYHKLENIIELGSIHDDRLMGIIYNAADIFVIPSLEDNLPNTVLESLCCGTPVIGFNRGGIPDIVQDEENGYLCSEVSVQSLKETLEKFLDNPTIFDREKIAQDAKEKYALEVQAKAYIELYRKILAK